MSKKKKLYIFGSGDLARELFDSIEGLELLTSGLDYEISGFIDIQMKDEKVRGLPVISEDAALELNKGDVLFILGLSVPSARKSIVHKFSQYTFPSFIHRSSSLAYQTNRELGVGNIVAANTYLSSNVEMGSFNFINWNVTIGHDVNLGIGNVFNPGCRISGWVNLGGFNFFGVNSVILEKIKIGENNIIGASTLILSNIGCNEKWVGVPAKLLGDV